MQLSVIIPVYNTRRYLSQCLESILSQDMKDYEVILINDGSTDGSYDICCNYAERYQQVRIYSESNKGVAAARNFGLRQALGDSIMFVDSDDWLMPGSFAYLYPYLGKTDVIVFKYIKCFTGGKTVQSEELEAEKIFRGGNEFLESTLSKIPSYPWYIWRYVFRTDFLKRIAFQFPNVRKYEDVSTTFRLIHKAESVMALPKAIYCYRKNREGSLTYEVASQTERDRLGIIEENIHEVQSDGQYSEKLKVLLCHNFSCDYYSSLILTYHISGKEERRGYLRDLQKCLWITDYTTGGKQKAALRLIKCIGLKPTAFLLYIRSILKGYLKGERGT